MKKLTIVMLALLCLCGCKTRKEIQTEYVYLEKTDTLRLIDLRIDSVAVHDSIVSYQKGDTVYKEKYHTLYKERVRVDTIEKIREKVVYQTLTETKTEEVNRLYWWQTALMWLGGIGLLTLILVFVYNFAKRK